MKKKLFVGFIGISVIYQQNMFAQSRLDLATIDEYLKIHKEFTSQVCIPGTEEKFNQLYKEYQGDGNYIPTQLDYKVDWKTIKNGLPLIDLKIDWIASMTEKLSLMKDFNIQKDLLIQLEKLNRDLLESKKVFFLTSNPEKQKNLKYESQKILEQIFQKVEDFKNSAPFLLSFQFPLNHLELRSEYEKVKETNDKEIKTRANSIFFTRKIVEDGSYDEESLRSDAMARAAFNTLYLSLKNTLVKSKMNDTYFLSDPERVDINFVIKNYLSLLQLGPTKFMQRFEEWGNRMKRSRMFYQNLLEKTKGKVSENSQLQEVTSLLENRSKALYNLKDFVLNREANTYVFWSSKSELYQSLFALETILYSEVGRTDANVGFFRQDVAQVAINRSRDSRFNQMGTNDQLVKYLPKEIKLNENLWLNVLFKEGEFSFTYFYIPGNLQIYCPDMSRVGKFLRKENLKIAMKLIEKPREDFHGIRYYSRVSMMGRIAMDSIWKEYLPVSEEKGNEILQYRRKLKSLYKKGQYRFLYEFDGPDNKSYRVIEIKGINYVVSKTIDVKFYTYRNPNLFKFFSFIK